MTEPLNFIELDLLERSVTICDICGKDISGMIGFMRTIDDKLNHACFECFWEE